MPAAARDAYCAGVDSLMAATPGMDKAFQAAVAADEGFALGHISLARAKQLLGRGHEAKEPLARARELAPERAALLAEPTQLVAELAQLGLRGGGGAACRLLHRAAASLQLNAHALLERLHLAQHRVGLAAPGRGAGGTVHLVERPAQGAGGLVVALAEGLGPGQLLAQGAGRADGHPCAEQQGEDRHAAGARRHRYSCRRTTSCRG